MSPAFFVRSANEVASGAPFKVRVYPWMLGATGSGGRYLGIYDLQVKGKVSN